MADENRILTGLFRGVPISITSSGLQGGFNVSIKQFPNRNTQSVETLGRIPRKFTLAIVVNDKPDAEYFSYRKRLLAAIEDATPGELIHPLYGRLDDVVCVSYSISESFTEFGSAVVQANFEINNNTGIPTRSNNVLTQIVRQNTNILAQVERDVAENFLVSLGFPGNFSDAVSKVTDFINTARQAVRFTGQNNTLLNEFNALLDGFESNVNGLVLNPSGLASNMTSVFTELGELFAEPGATQSAFAAFDGFGSQDTALQQNTAGRIQRQKNRDTINSAVSSAALSNTYTTSVQVEYPTVRDVDAQSVALEETYIETQENSSSDTTKGLITDLRINAISSLEEARAQSSNITTLRTTETSARLLAFELYGEDTQGENLANLNSISEVAFVDGTVEVFTNDA